MHLLITQFLSIGTTDICHYSYGIICLCINCPFWLLVYLQGAFIEDDDKADDEENPHMEDISDALSELFCLGFITGYLASAALVDRYPNVACILFGLGSDSVDVMFNTSMAIPVMLLWMFLTTMRVYHAAVKRAEKAKGGSKVEHADPLACKMV